MIDDKYLTKGEVRFLSAFLEHFELELDDAVGPEADRFRHYILNVAEYGVPSTTAYTRLNNIRRAFRKVYQDSPFLRAFDAGISEFWREIKPKKAKGTWAPKPLRFSVPQEDLPLHWREALRDMHLGFDGVDKAAPSPSILKTMRRKLCELAKICMDNELAISLNVETAILYERSLLNRERPLAAATIRSSIVHLRDFTLYLGLDEAIVEHLSARLVLHERRVARSTPLKETKIEKIPTYTEIFEQAFEMLGQADDTRERRVAQKLRNHAAALVLMCPFPLRVADTLLKFGDNLTWTGETYHLYVPSTSKNDEPFQATLLPFFRLFVDKLVLQGADPAYLDELRNKCMLDTRLLFESHNGSAPFDTYVSYAWAQVYGTGSHIARAKIHNDLAIFGLEGVEAALVPKLFRFLLGIMFVGLGWMRFLMRIGKSTFKLSRGYCSRSRAPHLCGA